MRTIRGGRIRSHPRLHLNALITLIMLLVGGIAMAQENLVANPSFERADAEGVVADGWTTREGIPVERRTDGGRSGDAYARFLDDDANLGQFLECERIPARPGGTYTASAWLRTGDECAPGVYVNFYDQFGTRIAHSFERASGPTEGWVQRLRHRHSAPTRRGRSRSGSTPTSATSASSTPMT
jgi:hypothetical protein